MKGNYSWSDLLQAILWMLTIPGLCLGTNVLHICQTDGDTAEAGSEGSIISQPGMNGYYLNCPLRLTGVLERSWFGLYVETLALPCTSKYCANTAWGRQCTTDETYIKIVDLNKKICQPSDTSNFYYYKNNTGPVTVTLHSDHFTFKHSFNLTYRVASVIDNGEDAPYHVVDTTGQQSGYVVSHSTYGNENYGENINSNLTLTSLRSNSIELHFFHLNLRSNNCTDKLIIYGVNTTTMCVDNSSEYVDKWKNFETFNNQVTFQFISDSYFTSTESGFMFKYEVLETQPSPRPLLPTTTHKATLETPMSTQRRETAVLTESTVVTSPTTQRTLAPSKAPKSTVGTPLRSTQREQTTNESLVTSTETGGTTPGNYYSNFSDTAKAGAALFLAVNTPSPFGGSWYIPFGVGVGSGLALAVMIAVAVAAFAMKIRRNRKHNISTRNLNEERTESGNGLEMTGIEVAKTVNDGAAAAVEDLEPSHINKQEALLTNQKVHSDVDIQSVRNETEIASDTQNASVRTSDEENIYQFADED